MVMFYPSPQLQWKHPAWLDVTPAPRTTKTQYIISWVHIMLHTHVFSRLTIWHQTTNRCYLYVRQPLSLPGLLSCLWLFGGWDLVEFSPSSLACLLVSSYSSHIWNVILVELYGYSFWHFQETKSQSKLLEPRTLRIFRPLLPQCLLSFRFYSYRLWNWVPILCIFIGCGFLK